MKKIAVDAMGGDYAPQAIVEGVNQALADFSDIEIQLYGDESKIKQYLTATDRVSIIHTDEKIDSDDEPTKAIRKKKNASMVLAAKAVKDGEADAVDRDGALFNDAPQKLGRGANREYQRISLGAHGEQAADPVNVPAHKVAAEATRCRESALQIDKAACAQFSEIRAMQGFRHDIGGKALSGKSAHG